MAGFYFPVFFLQLNAIKNGLPPDFAFYTVSSSILMSDRIIMTLCRWLVNYTERGKHLRPRDTTTPRTTDWYHQPDDYL